MHQNSLKWHIILIILEEVELCLTGKRAGIASINDRCESRYRSLGLRYFLSVLWWNWLQCEVVGTGLFAAESVSVASGAETLRIMAANSDSVFVCVRGKSPAVFPSHHHYCESFSFGWTVPLKENLLYLFFMDKLNDCLVFVFPLELSVCSLSRLCD